MADGFPNIPGTRHGSDGFPNKPRILHGAFVEYGLSAPPLVVVFQFNPVQLSRNRSLTFKAPGKGDATQSLRELHQGEKGKSLLVIRDEQQVEVNEESINFEIRLDATDRLNDGDRLTEQFGLAPQLATLEAMVFPKKEGLLGSPFDKLLGASKGFSFAKSENPPMILFIWGRKRVLPVNINSLNITETEFSTELNPIRATVSVNLTVIEGPNGPFSYSQVMKESMSALNTARLPDIVDVVIPG